MTPVEAPDDEMQAQSPEHDTLALLLPARRYSPDGHVPELQAPGEAPPHPTRFWPEGQPWHDTHPSDPDETLYLPLSQLTQLPAELPLHPTRYWPAGQPGHVAQIESVLYSPAAHVTGAQLPAESPPQPVRV